MIPVQTVMDNNSFQEVPEITTESSQNSDKLLLKSAQHRSDEHNSLVPDLIQASSQHKSMVQKADVSARSNNIDVILDTWFKRNL